MNITRENLSELDLLIKIEVVENDYAEKVAKSLKEYQKKATVPGFRKGMAPMGLIQRMYKSAVVADEVQNLLSESLYKYIDEEKLDIIGSPLSNTEKTGEVDFSAAKDYTFYFDAALAPKFDLAWDKVEAKLYQIKVGAKDIDKQVEEITQRYGKFETPETVGEGDYVYGKAVELDKAGQPKEGGVNTFASFSLGTVKNSDEIMPLFVGKKNDEKVVFNASKAFTASDIEKVFRLDTAAAKKFKSDVEFTISGCSHITPHEINEDLFKTVFPGQEVKDAAAFRKLVGKDMEKEYNQQCEILYVNEVRKQLIDNFNAPIPEAFLKRWILSRDEKNLTAEKLDAEWADNYVPSLKWEFVDGALNKISPIDASHNEIVDEVKNILRPGDQLQEGETEEAREKRLEQAAQSIAKDRENVQRIADRIYVHKAFELFKGQLKPEAEKITIKEFSEIAKG